MASLRGKGIADAISARSLAFVAPGLSPPQFQQFVDVVMNPRVDLGLADGRGLHGIWLLVSIGSIASARAFVLYFFDRSEFSIQE